MSARESLPIASPGGKPLGAPLPLLSAPAPGSACCAPAQDALSPGPAARLLDALRSPRARVALLATLAAGLAGRGLWAGLTPGRMAQEALRNLLFAAKAL
ncbi:MAG: hypothetical protein HYY66_06895, partial [Candidatus Tectomicrobia bacterium]|nr:hypothetical protein [Candidatus Tectomicrobia bacterium]